MSAPELRVLAELDEETFEQLHRVIADVVEIGGAVGWLSTPTRQETRRWLTDVLEHARQQRAGLLTVAIDGRIEAIGGWRLGVPGPKQHVAEIVKVMTHPDARGHGLGRVLVEALLAGVTAAGAETVTLTVRGNNHGAQALYESVGFRVWGVLPDGIGVGHERFDDVHMYRPLHTPAGVVRRGTRAEGTGGSVDRRRAGRPADGDAGGCAGG